MQNRSEKQRSLSQEYDKRNYRRVITVTKWIIYWISYLVYSNNKYSEFCCVKSALRKGKLCTNCTYSLENIVNTDQIMRRLCGSLANCQHEA